MSLATAALSYGLKLKFLSIGSNYIHQWTMDLAGRDVGLLGMSYYEKSMIAHNFAVGLTFLGVLMAGYSIYTTIDEMLDYYKVTFTPIPKYIVDETDIYQEINGKNIVINNQTAYYKLFPATARKAAAM